MYAIRSYYGPRPRQAGELMAGNTQFTILGRFVQEWRYPVAVGIVAGRALDFVVLQWEVDAVRVEQTRVFD